MYRAIRDGVKEMLSYALAIAVAFSSLVLFSTAFLMSNIHRQDDFLWSGVGLFYALVLWFCARNITGAVLLGQTAAATLIVSYSWQTLKLRKAVANPEQAAEINSFSLLQAANGLLNRQKTESQPEIVAPQIATPEKVTEETIAIPKAAATKSPAKNSDKAKSGRFRRFFGKQKKSNITNTKLDEILEEEIAVKTSKNTANDNVKSAVVNIPQTVESPTPEKFELNQQAEAKANDAKSSVEPKPLSQPVTEPVETPQSPTDSNDTVLEVADSQPLVDSTSSVSPPQSKQNEQSVTVVPEATINVPNSPVVQESKPQTTSQKGSDLENSPIEKNNPTKLESETQTEAIFTNSDDTSKPSASVVKPSVLDSLETVEVAEVLEALPEDAANNRGQQGQENIIEVTTTEFKEINIATEVTKIEQNQNKETDADEKQT